MIKFDVILDCLAAGMTAEEITSEYPMVTVASVRAVGGVRTDRTGNGTTARLGSVTRRVDGGPAAPV